MQNISVLELDHCCWEALREGGSMECFPNPCDLRTLFLRVSHGTDADQKAAWEKCWSKLFCLSWQFHASQEGLTHSGLILLMRKWPCKDIVSHDGNSRTVANTPETDSCCSVYRPGCTCGLAALSEQPRVLSSCRFC